MLVLCFVCVFDDSSSFEASRGVAMALSMVVGFSVVYCDIGLGLKFLIYVSEKFFVC